MTIKSLVLILLACFIMSCSMKDRIGYFDLASIFVAKAKSLGDNQQAKINLCKEIPFEWDQIIVMPPYTTIDAISDKNLKNIQALKMMLPELTMDEGKCILLIIKDKSIIKYSGVPRKILDFNSMVTNNLTTTLPKDKACNRLYVKNNGDHMVVGTN